MHMNLVPLQKESLLPLKCLGTVCRVNLRTQESPNYKIADDHVVGLQNPGHLSLADAERTMQDSA